MKKNKTGFISGVLTTLLVISLINPAVAATTTQTISAAFNSVNIKVNGTQVAKVGDSYTLANGTQVPYSIVYNGTTYLPMRKVGELVGLDVNWDGNSNTASLGNTVSIAEFSLKNISYEQFKTLLTLKGESSTKPSTTPAENKTFHHYFLTFGKIDKGLFIKEWNSFYSINGKDYLKKLYEEYSQTAPYNEVVVNLDYGVTGQFIYVSSQGVTAIQEDGSPKLIDTFS